MPKKLTMIAHQPLESGIISRMAAATNHVLCFAIPLSLSGPIYQSPNLSESNIAHPPTIHHPPFMSLILRLLTESQIALSIFYALQHCLFMYWRICGVSRTASRHGYPTERTIQRQISPFQCIPMSLSSFTIQSEVQTRFRSFSSLDRHVRVGAKVIVTSIHRMNSFGESPAHRPSATSFFQLSCRSYR